MRNAMPQNQGGLDAILLVGDKKENLISNLANSSWIYEKLVTDVRLSDYITDTKHRIFTSLLNFITASPLGHNYRNWLNTHHITSAQPAAGAHIGKLVVV